MSSLEGVVLFICLCSLAGVPPLRGFSLKWIILCDFVSWFGLGAIVAVLLISIRAYFYVYSRVLSLLRVVTKSRRLGLKYYYLLLFVFHLQGWVLLWLF
jgi:formate hydrogenlyase subunit 3/multisubunit Na+/H+ antiporter MnhD subunit